MRDLLVVKNDVRTPDMISRDVEALDSPVLLGVPHQLVVPPELLHPQVGRHDLVLQILQKGGKETLPVTELGVNNIKL